MADLGGTFDSDTVEPQAPMTPLPNGWYAMQIKESEIKDVASGNGNKYLQLNLEIDENHHPEHKGRMAFDRLNLWNSNTTASEIAQRTLSAICRAVGVPKVKDSTQLHGRVMAVRIAYKPAKGEYGEGNDVKGYEPLAAHFGAAAAPQAATAAPAAPAAPTAAPAAPAAAETPAAPAAAPAAPAAPSGASPAPWTQPGQG